MSLLSGWFLGLAAELYLALSRLKVAVIDTGLPRNRFASSLHGLFGQEGADPHLLLATALRQLLAYPSVQWLAVEIVDGPASPMIDVDSDQMTSVPGVHAAGDVAKWPHYVSWAVADGVTAAIAIHRALAFDWIATAFSAPPEPVSVQAGSARHRRRMEEMHTTVPRHFWLISALLALWGLSGCIEWVLLTLHGPAAMGLDSTYDLQLRSRLPWWHDYSHAASVGAMLVGGLALLFRRKWARQAFLVSLVGALAQFGYLFAATDYISVKGFVAAVPFPLVIALLSLAAMWFAAFAARRNWVA